MSKRTKIKIPTKPIVIKEKNTAPVINKTRLQIFDEALDRIEVGNVSKRNKQMKAALDAGDTKLFNKLEKEGRKDTDKAVKQVRQAIYEQEELVLKQILGDETIKVSQKALDNLRKALNPFNLSAPVGSGMHSVGGLLKRATGVTSGRGFNTYMKHYGLKDIFEFVEHYLSHQEPHNYSYRVFDYNDVAALAYSTGIMPKTLFDFLAKEIRKNKKHYKKKKISQNMFAICELVDHFDKAKPNMKAEDYSLKQIATSKFYKDWCVRNDIDMGINSKKPEERLREYWNEWLLIAGKKMMEYEKTIHEVEQDLAFYEAEAAAGNTGADKKIKGLLS